MADYHAARYDVLIAHEDQTHTLLRALRGGCPVAAPDVVETSAGTGRVTFLAPSQRRERVWQRQRDPALRASGLVVLVGHWMHLSERSGARDERADERDERVVGRGARRVVCSASAYDVATNGR